VPHSFRRTKETLTKQVSPEAARGVATALAWEEALGGGRRAGEEKSQTAPDSLAEEQAF